jgi:hypothetical protein
VVGEPLLNPCELKIDLLCQGMRLPGGIPVHAAQPVTGGSAGLGSGLEILLPTGSRFRPAIPVNVPVAERFVQRSPYVLSGAAPDYDVRDERTGFVYPVRIPPRPPWYHRQTSRDVPMSQVASLQGSLLQIYLHPACAFWDTSQHCLFCTTAKGSRTADFAPKTIDDVLETCWAAKAESGVTLVQLNGGFQGSQGLASVEPFVRAIKQEVGLLVGVQLAPERNLTGYERLIDAGVDAFSFCVELLDAYWFSRICPGKARLLGQPLFFRAMEYCASRLPGGAVSGEVIAGLEPFANTIEALGRITAIGVVPTVCIFRPTPASEMADWPSPRYEDMRQVMQAMYEACRRTRLPIGVGPNVDWSLVVTPEDAGLLAPRNAAFYRYELWRRAVRLASRPRYGSRLRARSRRIPVATAGEPGAGSAA